MNNVKYLRYLILGIILIGIILIHFLHINEGPSYPSVHAMCPIGGLENFWNWVNGKANMQKLFSGTMTLFFLTIFFAFIFGKTFCGNICPFGALQEFTGKITNKKIHISPSLDKFLRQGKYFVLLLITLMAWSTSSLWIAPYDPYTAFAHIWSGQEVFSENLIGLIVLIIILISSLFIDRTFCKYLCPAGALYGIIAKFSLFKIKHNDCTNCGKCVKCCPMNINVYKAKELRSIECIACGQCIANCPSKQSPLKITILGQPFKPSTYIALSVFIFFGSLFALDKAGLYQLTIPSTTSIVESKNYLKFSDLRGSMTIEDGAAYTGIALDEFYRKFEIPETVPKTTRFKEINKFVPGYSFEKIKNSK